MKLSQTILLMLALNQLLIGSETLHQLSDEQITISQSFIHLFDENQYHSKIDILLPNGESETFSYKQFKKAVKVASKTKDSQQTKATFLESFAKTKQTLIANVDHPKIFIFSNKTGDRLIKFECLKVKIGKTKLGIFEIPSNKILFESPKITYY